MYLWRCIVEDTRNIGLSEYIYYVLNFTIIKYVFIKECEIWNVFYNKNVPLN